MSTNSSARGRGRLAVLGAGPVGLDAALAGVDAGYDVRVYEAGARPAANVRDWGHVRLFSPWSMNVSSRMRAHLDDLGAAPEVDEGSFPTGHELAEKVIDPLWSRPPLASTLSLNTRVVAVGRQGLLKHEEIGAPGRARRAFRILLRDFGGRERVEPADVVLDCTGKFSNPNTLGDGGIPAPGERLLADRIERRLPNVAANLDDWRGRTILVVGGGHSAQTVVRDLSQTADPRGMRLLWAVRKSHPTWGAVEGDPLPGRRDLTRAAEGLRAGASPLVEVLTGCVVDRLASDNGTVRVRLRHDDGRRSEIEVDRVLSLTGGVGDHTIYRQLQVHECYATSGPMRLSAALLADADADCLLQEGHGVDTLKNPEPGFFLLGDKSYGRNSTFLLRVGWQQVDEVFGELARTS